MRVAVDANVLIAGTVFPRWPHEILMHALAGDFTLVLLPIVIREARRRIRREFPEFESQFEEFLASVGYEEAPVPRAEEIAAHQGLVRQAKDIPVALSVRAAKTDYFVTYDRDFTDADETTAAVRKAIAGIRLPPVFLREVMGWTSEELEAIRYRTWADVSA